MVDERGGAHCNRLSVTASPYLLQHAENPVDWYPWGEEAFAKAKAEDKPVFLSIGYATCHWCHVMAHESFEDPEVAAVLNRYFVAVKVDREERPDIDDQYMAVAQMMTGSGGWPLTIIMAPDKRPFFAATYLPKTPRMGMPGIIPLLENLAFIWKNDRERVEHNCAAVVDALARSARPTPAALPEIKILDEAFRKLVDSYDDRWGGFGSAPKFPRPTHLSYLLRYWRRRDEPGALAIVEQSLTLMRAGGIYDQLGGGFHRYAVDRQWLIPHFEKMLYDQALLIIVFLETFQATGDPCYRETAIEICDFVLLEMTSPDGGFYSALDADSDGVEGKYYLWTPAEIQEVLGEAEGVLCCRLFDISDGGNFDGANILHLSMSLELFAKQEGFTPETLRRAMERWRQLLFQVRGARIRPFRDEKTVTAWNGLMIAALAKAFAVCGEPRFLLAAQKGSAFISSNLQNPEGGLLRSFFRGQVSVPGFLEDYAFFVRGLLELYAATLDWELLTEACRLTRKMMELFKDDRGGFFAGAADAEQLLVRAKGATDGVIPSANAVAAMNLLMLGRLLEEASFLNAAEELLGSCMGSVAGEPAAYLQMLAAFDYLRGGEVEITLAGEKGGEVWNEMYRCIQSRFMPNLLLRWKGVNGGEGGELLSAGCVVAHVCAEGACHPPVTTATELGILLDRCGYGIRNSG